MKEGTLYQINEEKRKKGSPVNKKMSRKDIFNKDVKVKCSNVATQTATQHLFSSREHSVSPFDNTDSPNRMGSMNLMDEKINFSANAIWKKLGSNI